MRSAPCSATAICVKVYPAYLLFPLWVGGWKRLVLWGGALTTLFMLLPALLVADGVEGSFRGFFQVNGGVVEIGEAEPGPQRGYVPGQSLRAVFHRYLTDSDATAHDKVYRSIHIVDWPRDRVAPPKVPQRRRVH